MRLVNEMPVIKSVKHRGLVGETDRLVGGVGGVEFVNADCVDVCVGLSREGRGARVGLLNMASERCPGGGVRHGAKAQEEEICRRTTLYRTLAAVDGGYPLAFDEIVYSPGVVVVKDARGRRLAESDRATIDVLSSAAIRRPDVVETAGEGSRFRHASDRETMRLKIRILLQTAERHGLNSLVLGAWGCGAFANPVEDVARLFAEELAHVTSIRVIFAILDMPDRRPLFARFRDTFASFHV